MIKYFKSLLFILLFINITLLADDKQTTQNEFVATFNKIIIVVKNKSLTKEQRDEKIVKTIEPIFDFELMAKLSLGKKWKRISKDEQKEFISLYVSRMKKSYSSKIDGYSDEKVIVNSIKQVKRNRIVLDTSLVGESDSISIRYKYYLPRKQKENKNRWLVYDVVIKGVSMIKSDKAQFKEVLKQNTIQVLMDKIRK